MTFICLQQQKQRQRLVRTQKLAYKCVQPGKALWQDGIHCVAHSECNAAAAAEAAAAMKTSKVGRVRTDKTTFFLSLLGGIPGNEQGHGVFAKILPQTTQARSRRAYIVGTCELQIEQNNLGLHNL